MFRGCSDTLRNTVPNSCMNYRTLERPVIFKEEMIALLRHNSFTVSSSCKALKYQMTRSVKLKFFVDRI